MKSPAFIIHFIACLMFPAIFMSCNQGTQEAKEIIEPPSELTHTILGGIHDWKDQTAVAGIQVHIEGFSKYDTFITDSDGSYSFTVEDGLYTISPVEPPDSEYYFYPTSREAYVNGGDISVTGFYAIRYPILILRNNGPRQISVVRIANVDQPNAWSDNLVENGLSAGSDSRHIRMDPGSWNIQVAYLEDSETLVAFIDDVKILPADTLIYPLNSILRIINSGSKTIVQVMAGECETNEWITYHPTNEIPPGSESENIYLWTAGCYDLLLCYADPSKSYLPYVWVRDVLFSPGDTVYVTFEE